MSGADRTIRWSTAAAVIGVAVVAAVVSYEHAYALVSAHGELGWTARLIPLTVDGLIWASSMVMLDSVRRGVRIPLLARWLLGLGISATLAANVAHGLGHGPVGSAVAAWPAVALVGSYELLMIIIRGAQSEPSAVAAVAGTSEAVPGINPLHARAAQEFAKEVAAGRKPSIRAIRARLHVGQPRAPQVQAHLGALIEVGEVKRRVSASSCVGGRRSGLVRCHVCASSVSWTMSLRSPRMRCAGILR
jgi:hypothetical protein